MSKYVQDNEWGTKYPNFRKDEFRCPCCDKQIDTLQKDKLILATCLNCKVSIASKYKEVIKGQEINIKTNIKTI